jgi:serine protease Do
VRNGKPSTIDVTIADRQKLFATRLGDEEEGGEEAAPQESKLGINVKDITPDLADRMKLPNSKGVIVQDVKPGGFGDNVGVSRGDVVLEINKQPVNSEGDFNKLQAQLKSGQDVVLLVRPRGLGPNAGTVFMGGTLP